MMDVLSPVDASACTLETFEAARPQLGIDLCNEITREVHVVSPALVPFLFGSSRR